MLKKEREEGRERDVTVRRKTYPFLRDGIPPSRKGGIRRGLFHSDEVFHF
jgi:hypothetical protein